MKFYVCTNCGHEFDEHEAKQDHQPEGTYNWCPKCDGVPDIQDPNYDHQAYLAEEWQQQEAYERWLRENG